MDMLIEEYMNIRVRYLREVATDMLGPGVRVWRRELERLERLGRLMYGRRQFMDALEVRIHQGPGL